MTSFYPFKNFFLLLQKKEIDVFFLYSLIFILFIFGLTLLGLSRSSDFHIKKEKLYELGQSVKLNCDGKEPTIFSVPIKVKKQKQYVIRLRVSGAPEIRVDFWGEGYDNPEQKIIIDKSIKKDFVAEKIFNSENPPEKTFLRIYFLDRENIEIDELSLYEVFSYPINIKYLAYILFLVSYILLLFVAKKRFLKFILVSSVALLVYSQVKLPEMSQGGDNMWYIPQVFSLITEQNIDLNEYEARIKAVNHAAVITVKGRELCYFPYGSVLINYPLTLITKNLFDCRLSTENERLSCADRVAAINAKIIASISVGLIFLIVLHITSSMKQSLLFAFIFAFASPHFSNHAGGLWSHNISVFLIIFSMYLMIVSRYSYLSSIPLFLSYITRPSMSISVVFLSLYFAFKNWSMRFNIMKYLIFFALMALFFLGVNIVVYNAILPPYYSGSRLSFHYFQEAIFGIFISPSRGLFIFFPLALFSFYGIYLVFIKKESFNEYRLFYIILSLGVLAHSFIYSLFPHWWMGYSYGPRMFVEIAPYLILLIIPALNHIKKFKILKILFVLCLIISLYSQIIGVVSEKSIALWNVAPSSIDQYPSRLWDWSDMQMFRWLKKD
jgi:hypothetical protein